MQLPNDGGPSCVWLYHAPVVCMLDICDSPPTHCPLSFGPHRPNSKLVTLFCESMIHSLTVDPTSPKQRRAKRTCRYTAPSICSSAAPSHTRLSFTCDGVLACTQVAYIRPNNQTAESRFVRRARHAIEKKVRRAARNVVQVGLKWIDALTGQKKKKEFNVLDIIVRLQRKYRRSKGKTIAKTATAAKPADAATATSRRAARRRRRSRNLIDKRQSDSV